MMKFVRPSRKGLIVRDHKNSFRPLPDSGKDVLWDITWAKRARDGDILLGKPPAADPVKPTYSKDKKGAE